MGETAHQAKSKGIHFLYSATSKAKQPKIWETHSLSKQISSFRFKHDLKMITLRIIYLDPPK